MTKNNNNDKNTKTTIKSFKERIELCNAMDDIKYRPIDLGVGLHCCGNFTDIAIKHCKEIKANFIFSRNTKKNVSNCKNSWDWKDKKRNFKRPIIPCKPME